jgi:hypothetical protein
MCVVDRCRGPPLSTTVVPVGKQTEGTVMTHYTNPALEAELAYRRERLAAALHRDLRGHRRWFPTRRRNAR